MAKHHALHTNTEGDELTLKIELEYITARCKQLHVNITKLGITEGFKEKDLMTVHRKSKSYTVWSNDNKPICRHASRDYSLFMQ